MKIYEIILEAPEAVSPGGIVIPAGAKTATPVVTPPTKSYTAGNKAGKTYKAAKDALGSPAVQRVNALAKKVILRDKIAGEVVNNKMAQALGGYLRFLKILGYGAIAYELWQQKIAIDTLVAEQQISKEDGSAAYRMQCEKFAAAILVSAGLRGLIRVISTVSGLRWVIRIGGALGGAPTGGATIVAALATEAAIVYLTNKLTTPEGQQMLSWMVMHLIDPAAVWMWNMGFGKFYGEIKEIDPEAGEKVDAATQANAQARAGDKTAQGAQPAAGSTAKTDVDSTSSSELAAKPFDASGGNQKWGVSDPYANLPKLKDIKLK